MGVLRVSLISPNNLGSYRSAQVIAENLGIAQLSSYAESLGHHVQLVDARLSDYGPEQCADIVNAFQPDVLGLSLISQQAVPWSNGFLRALAPTTYKPVTLVGGYFPTLQPEAALGLMSSVDAAALGEGEPVLGELLRRIANRSPRWQDTPGLCLRSECGSIPRRTRPPLIRDLNVLPWPKRYAAHFMDERLEVLVEGSRGCKLACSFCAIKPFFAARGRSVWRGRSPENIVSEMVAIRHAHPQVKKFRFVDADFIGFDAEGENRALQLANLCVEHLPGIELYIEVRVRSVIAHPHVFKRLRRAGLREVFVGIESGSQRILNTIGKSISVSEIRTAVSLLKELGVSVSFGFMMFTPWTEDVDLYDSLSMLKDLGDVEFDKFFHELDLIPGTPAFSALDGVVNLSPKNGTGYFTYPLRGLPALARLCGRSLELRHRPFLESIWLLYKDVQESLQAAQPGAAELGRRVSQLNIAMFEFCLRSLQDGPAPDEQSLADTVADACVAEFSATVAILSETVDEHYTFPRPRISRERAWTRLKNDSSFRRIEG